METCAAPSPHSSARPRWASVLSKCTKPCATPIAPPETSKTQECRRTVCSNLPRQDTPETSCRRRERWVNEARAPRSRVQICRIEHVPCKLMNSFFTPARWLDGLWRNRVFVKLWGSLTITHFGGQVTFLALPLTAALMLDASPLEVGVLTALEALPYPIFGLFAGVLVDRARRARAPGGGEREDRRGRFGGPARRARPRRSAHPVAHGALRDPPRRVLLLLLGVDAARHSGARERRAEGRPAVA